MKAKHPERADRLRYFFNRLSIKNVALASKLGIKPAFISQLLHKHATVTTDVAIRISKVYPMLNVTWLLDGDGEMLLEKEILEPGLLTGVLEPDAVYGKGEGRLEYLERMVRELDERVRRLEGKEE